MSLAARISEERERLALAKERLRGRRGMSSNGIADTEERYDSQLTRDVKLERPKVNLSMLSNRKFDLRSPKSTAGVSVKVHSSSSSHHPVSPRGNQSSGKASKSSTPRRRQSSASSVDFMSVNGGADFTSKVRQFSAREAALSAKLDVAEKKIEYAEAELTAKANICDQLQETIVVLRQSLEEMEGKVRQSYKEKCDAVSERDIARKRVYTLSERVSWLEKEIDHSKADARELTQRAMISSNKSNERVEQTERELAELRTTLSLSKDQLEAKSSQCDELSKRCEGLERVIETLSARCTDVEGLLNEANELKEESLIAQTLIEEKCSDLQNQVKLLEKRESESASESKKLESRLEQDLRRQKLIEDQLRKEMNELSSKLSEARVEIEKQLERAKESLSKAKAAEEQKQRSAAMYEQELRKLREQLARTTLSTNARVDTQEKRIAELQDTISVLQVRLASKSSSHKTSPVHSRDILLEEEFGMSNIGSASNGSWRGSPAHLQEQGPMAHLEQQGNKTGNSDLEDLGEGDSQSLIVEELVVDVDLPNGDSVELVVRAHEDPSQVVSEFSKRHALTPRVSEHLERYILGQLGELTNFDGLESSRSPSPPPPPPPSSPPPSIDDRMTLNPNNGDISDRGEMVDESKESSSGILSGTPSAEEEDETPNEEVVGKSKSESRLRRLSKIRERQGVGASR